LILHHLPAVTLLEEKTPLNFQVIQYFSMMLHFVTHVPRGKTSSEKGAGMLVIIIIIILQI